MMGLLERIAEKGNFCTGCGLCSNVCHVDAVDMKPDRQGFLYPSIDEERCINCGECYRLCPKINPTFGNYNDPDCYAAWANDDVRAVSSSGGAFSLLAKIVLDAGGVVCGVTMEPDYKVHHICIEDTNDLYRLRKSKYVQSNTEYVYRQIKRYLDDGRTVLFTGCPCQVAAARNFFANSRGTIYYMDILCHGVPSQKMWLDYINESFDREKLTGIDFRSKLNGWRAEQLRVFWNDGTSQRIPWPESAYEEGFQNNIDLRDGCEDCEFATYPRQGDITIGDFWRIEDYDPSLNDGRGTSLIFVNNEVGEELLSKIKTDFMMIKKVPKEAARWNRLDKQYASHPRKDRYKTLYPGHTFTDAVMQCRHEVYDIGLVGVYRVKNYGGHLTQFALYSALTDMGYSVYMIECPSNSAVPPNPQGPYLFRHNPYPEYAMSKIFENIAEMKFLNLQCKTFIVGSDQMFNNNLYNNHNKFMALNFVTDNHRKIAYAASWGHDRIWGLESDRAEESYYLRKFDFFSVREDSAIDLAEREFGVQGAVHVLDPVFLCRSEIFERMADEGAESVPNRLFLFSYILDPDSEKEMVLRYFAEARGLGIKAVLDEDPQNRPEEFWSIDTLTNASIEDWLAHIVNSEYVITDSFHGMCFAIIFHKPFYAIVNKLRGETRFTSIAKQLGLTDRLVYSFDQLKDKMNDATSIDYDAVDRILESEKEESVKWLRNAIDSDPDKRKPLTEYDILDGRCDDIQKSNDLRYDELLRRIERIEGSWSYKAGRLITWPVRRLKRVIFK